MELDPDRKRKVFKPSRPNRLARLRHLGNWIDAKINREEIDSVELTRADDDAEVAYTVAIRMASDVHGLLFLPPRLQTSVQLKLAERFLKKSGAPKQAITKIRGDLEDKETGPLFTQLFSASVLEKYDLTPEAGQGENYFEKYFQPLLVSFDKSHFEESVGVPPQERKECLVKHLKYLSDGRARGASFDEEGGVLPKTEIKDLLPSTVPSGPNPTRKREVRNHNENDAVLSLVFVSMDTALDKARNGEMTVNDALDRVAEVDYLRWTPDTDNPPERACFYWQAKDESLN